MSGSEIDKPATGAFDANAQKSDTVELTKITRSIYVDSVAGGTAAKVTFKNGNTITLNNLAAGTVYPFQIRQLWSTGTTATIIGLT